MKISFMGGYDNLETQIKQVMRENYNDMEKQAVNNCSLKINNEFKDDFVRQIDYKENNMKIPVLKSLRDAYKNADMNEQASAIDNQLQKLNVKG